MMRPIREMSAEEKEWRGRDDARIIAEAESIKADKERFANAQKQAKVMLAEREQELSGLAKIAGSPIPKNFNHHRYSDRGVMHNDHSSDCIPSVFKKRY